MQLPLAYLDPAAIEEVSIPVWREVFDTVGWPVSLTAIRDSFQHAEILRAFADDPPSDSLLQALEALDSFGTEHGRPVQYLRVAANVNLHCSFSSRNEKMPLSRMLSSARKSKSRSEETSVATTNSLAKSPEPSKL
jgi:hypothetical protein